MRIAQLQIVNFRGIREGKIRFKKYPILVGPNNCGKTTVVEALALLLGRDRLVRELTEHDFFGSDPQPADRIKLIATIVDFAGDDPDAHQDWFREGRAVEKWLNEADGTIHPTRTDASLKLCCQIAFQARFDHDSLTVETVRYFHDHDNPVDPFVEDTMVQVPGKLIQQLGFYLVRASRTWDRVLSWGSELFRRTLRAAAGQPSAAVLAERDRLRQPAAPIEVDPAIRTLIEHVNVEITRYVPGAPEIKLRVTSTDSRSVMDSVVAHFAVAGGPCVPAARQGSGLLSLQGVLLLLELGRMRADAGEGFLMMLEEPELHLPPSSQQELVHRIQALSTQTIVTTHSPSIAAAADPTSVLILRNQNGRLSAEPFLEAPVPATAQNWIRKFFQQSRPEVIAALQHLAVLIPEGRSEYYLLRTVLRPLMLKQEWSAAMQCPFGLEVGVVPTEDAKVVETHAMLRRVHPRACCLVDGDAEGQRYAQQLVAATPAPAAILSWPDGWMLEDAVGWILQADEANVVAGIRALIDPLRPANAADVVERLKAKKMDIVLYEAIADAIANNAASAARAADLFGAISLACSGAATPRFTANAGVLTFQP